MHVLRSEIFRFLVSEYRVDGAGKIVQIQASDVCACLKRRYQITRIKLRITISVTVVKGCISREVILVLTGLKHLDQI